MKFNIELPDDWNFPSFESLLLDTEERKGIKIGPFGSALKKAEFTDSGHPVLGIENVHPNELRTKKMKYISEEKFSQLSAYQVYSGDILVTNMGTVGRSCVFQDMGAPTIISSHLIRATVDTRIANPYYICRAINDFEVCKMQIGLSAHGAIMAGFNTTLLKRLRVPLPPLNEQNRIVAILDKADKIKKETKRAVETRPKVLHSLFYEMFGDLVSIDKGWEKCALGTHIKIKHGYAFKSQFFTKEGDFVLLTPGNFWEEGGYKDRGEKQPYYVGEIPADYILSKNDLLVAMTEQAPGLLGSAIIISEDNRFLHNQRLGLVTYDENYLDLHFLYFLFNSPRIRALIQIRSTGTKVKHTSPTKMEEIEVFLPPIELQKEFAKYCRLENNNSDYDIVRVEELVNSITQEMIS